MDEPAGRFLFTIARGKIVAIDLVADPERLGRLDLEGLRYGRQPKCRPGLKADLQPTARGDWHEGGDYGEEHDADREEIKGERVGAGPLDAVSEHERTDG